RMIKARQGEALTARSDQARNNELSLMVLAHNLMIVLRRIREDFYRAASAQQVCWLLLVVLIAFFVWIMSTTNIPANPFGGLASDLFLAEIAAILAFYVIARSRSLILTGVCMIAFPSIQAMLIYGYQDSFDWLFEIL
ncbi:MAG: hypothetical protein AAGB26_11160, partial [Planctomycetota bacterium]